MRPATAAKNGSPAWWSSAHWLSLEAERGALHSLVHDLLVMAAQIGPLSSLAARVQGIVWQTLSTHEDMNEIARTIVATPVDAEILKPLVERLDVLKTKRLMLGSACWRGSRALRVEQDLASQLVARAADGTFGLLGTAALNASKYDGLPTMREIDQMDAKAREKLVRAVQ